MEQQPSAAPVGIAVQKKSLVKNLKDSCARNSGIALAIIIVLVVVVVYLYARLKGWIGSSEPKGKESLRSGSGAPSKRGASSKPSKKPKRASQDEDDDDIDALINAIES